MKKKLFTVILDSSTLPRQRGIYWAPTTRWNIPQQFSVHHLSGSRFCSSLEESHQAKLPECNHWVPEDNYNSKYEGLIHKLLSKLKVESNLHS